MTEKIYINLTRIGKNGSGLFRYSDNFINCISKNLKNSDLHIIHADNFKFSKAKSVSVPSFISNTPSVSFLRPMLWYIYSFVLFPKIDGRVITTTHHVVPGVKKQIITIHDLRPYFYPDSFLQKVYFRYILPYKIKQVDGIITVSNTTKDLIVDCYKVDPCKVCVVSNSVNITQFKPSNNIKNINPYLLMVGATWQHKNAQEVIEMCETWSHKYELKIVANRSAYIDGLKNIVNSRKLNDRVEFIERYISEEELVELYQNAKALVYPSLMEGFGIPPIEAMACGIPVIASDIKVFREICKDIPIYIKNGNKKSWYTAIEMLDDFSIINNKIKSGLERANYYSDEQMDTSIIKAVQNIWNDVKL
ncbi:glycosyltransferase family 4 protein|uniref:Glycosyltransferase involved in cell wall bisynthesis n=1 Tax=Dendrosporobacter quercicolus TaxID=146817 RepID=A0A1G9WPM8_9FIRM|nr:glycosyltransferase family 1 protein [Dendrosporobacter quercicolus]NSL49175.1 glycosyltransferase family 4 protein [Dendrosporobacter quercicolus DSM 1736]SDM86534.1 Glycosyltransferase involved in cell wall bisynthesis [Dendrosporobacter quercicolus]